MAAKLTDHDVAQINAQLAADPEWQTLYAQYASMPDQPNAPNPYHQAIQDYATRHGIPVEGNSLTLENGLLKLTHPYRTFLKDAALSAGIAGAGAAALGAFGAAAPAAGSASVAPAAGVSTAAGTGGGVFSKLVAPLLIKGGGDLVNGILQHKAATTASDQLKQGVTKAQAINQQMFDQAQAGYAPYTQFGQGALGMLSQGLGLPAYQAPAPASTGQTQAAPSMGMVNLRAPDGTVKAVPQSQAQHYLAQGAQQVS